MLVNGSVELIIEMGMGNCETPTGKERLARPRRSETEETCRLPRGKRVVFHPHPHINKYGTFINQDNFIMTEQLKQ